MVVKGSTMLVGNILTGRISDKALKYGKVKWISEIVCVLFGVFSLLCSFVKSFPWIMVYMALVGLVEGVWWATYPVVIMDITSGYCSNEAFGLVNLVVAFARLPGPPGLGKFFDKYIDLRLYS